MDKKAETRAAILEAAKRLFREHGFDATRVRDIALAARVSDQTVFNYFPSKEALLSQLAIDWYAGTAAWLAAEREALEAVPDLERFLSSLRAALNWAQEDRDLLRLIAPRALIVHATASPGPETPQATALVQQFESNQRTLREIFESFQKAGLLRDDVDPDFIAESYGALFQGVLINWAMRPEPSEEGLGDRVARALEVWFRGLART